jgi:hypothetical protein
LDVPSVYSFKALYDASPPLEGHVHAERILSNGTDSPQLLAHKATVLAYVSAATSLNVSWTGFVDLEDVVSMYEVSLLSCADASLAECSVQASLAVLNGSDAAIQIDMGTLDMIPSLPYALQVEAEDIAGHRSGKKLGLMMDETPPTAGRVVNTEGDASNSEVACLSETSVVHAFWSGFTDAESTVAGYEWCAGTEPCGRNLVDWTQVDAYVMRASAVLEEGRRLAVGERVHVTVRVSGGSQST